MLREAFAKELCSVGGDARRAKAVHTLLLNDVNKRCGNDDVFVGLPHVTFDAAMFAFICTLSLKAVRTMCFFAGTGLLDALLYGSSTATQFWEHEAGLLHAVLHRSSPDVL